MNDTQIAEQEKSRTALQTLIAALNENVTTLASRMGLESDAIVVNQCNENAYSEYRYETYRIRCFHSTGRGVGLSRNTALMHADSELCLFADEDIVYRPGYAQAVADTFAAHRGADLILFNVKQSKGRETYHIGSFGRVRWYNYGRYPAYAIAARTASLRKANVVFSLRFGGGAEFMNGEDSLFLHDCLKKGLKIYHAPVLIGEEVPLRPSTWFTGYTDKFFYDRGVLYRALYGRMAQVFAFRFLMKGRGVMCAEKPFAECFRLMKEGIRHEDKEGA